MKHATCIHCGTTLYPDDLNAEAPGLCNLCQQIEEEAARVCEAERAAMRERAESVQEQIRAAVREHNQNHQDRRAEHRANIAAAVEKMQQPMIVDGQQWETVVPHAEVTPAGLNFLLPGVEPIHTQQQGEGQQRLL